MRTLILSLISILSLGAYGQGKNYSINGLEGWGKKAGVKIAVEDYSRFDKSFDAKAIKTKVELKLRLAGIKIAKEKPFSFDSILINAQPINVGGRVLGYSLDITPQRKMTFEYAGKTYIAVGASNESYGGIASASKLLPRIDEYMDELLVDYLKANPKKE